MYVTGEVTRNYLWSMEIVERFDIYSISLGFSLRERNVRNLHCFMTLNSLHSGQIDCLNSIGESPLYTVGIAITMSQISFQTP